MTMLDCVETEVYPQTVVARTVPVPCMAVHSGMEGTVMGNLIPEVEAQPCDPEVENCALKEHFVLEGEGEVVET